MPEPLLPPSQFQPEAHVPPTPNEERIAKRVAEPIAEPTPTLEEMVGKQTVAMLRGHRTAQQRAKFIKKKSAGGRRTDQKEAKMMEQNDGGRRPDQKQTK